MHKRKLESTQRDKRNKTLKAQRENKRGQGTAGPKLLRSGRGPWRKQRPRQNTFQPEIKGQQRPNKDLKKSTKPTYSKLREEPSKKVQHSARRETEENSWKKRRPQGRSRSQRPEERGGG